MNDSINTAFVQFNIKLPYTITKDDDWYVSSCFPLNVVSQGKTQKKALDNLKEALQIFLSSCFEEGKLDEVLKECGFNLIPNQADVNMDAKEQKKYKTINIPLNFSTQTSELPACHA